MPLRQQSEQATLIQQLKKQASRLLVNVGVSEEIPKRRDEFLKAIKSVQISTLKGIHRCAHYNVRKLFDDTEELRDIKDIDNDTAAAIESIKALKRKRKDGYETGVKVKLVGKLKSLELISKYQSLFK
jgi:hypothetical protein